MNRRLEQFMKAEGLTSAKFAEILSVQPSSISHLLSGRNNPNFDFISKLLVMFPNLNPHWIINGQGSMYLSNLKSDSDANNLQSDIIQSTDNSSGENPTNHIQTADNQDLNLFNSVIDIVNPLKEDAINNDQSSIENPQTLVKPADNNSLNITKSVDIPLSIQSSTREVKQVLLLYNDHTFEFYYNSNK